jgi:hypothetical protein
LLFCHIYSYFAQCKREYYENRYYSNPNIAWNRRTFWAVFLYTAVTSALFVVGYLSLVETRRYADTAVDTEKRQLRAYVLSAISESVT